MKDEEMAKEYVKKEGFRSSMFGVLDNITSKANKEIEQAFLAGLKAGRPQWHDLRKNPNDLPEKMSLGSIEVYIEYKDGVTDFAYYRFDKKWWVRSENEELAENVIAWCKIPQFKE